MSTEFLKLILDLLILAGLGGFMYYALRLSKALNAFKNYRNEFEAVMQDLSQHINKAQLSIQELRTTSDESAADLRKLVKNAQFLCDELQLITETGDALAQRLEGLAEKNSRAAQSLHHDNVRDLNEHRNKDDQEFVIRDIDVDDDFDDAFMSDEDNEALSQLSSEAEKELYQALKKTQQKT